ncbi:hypothetical protein [Herbiconiux sp. L3-i23]|uniref:hypothetical protein n=1 Tax=Herbiconiux sp. L3-i23 TaxID=2905871 RepID=UPI00205E3909|nr:hypothetical protein [Herbiconiux sp. L3-i23]BDI23235.1 hypothetical protein L3i23_20110 [Herbiconiux sp. L3-i23]
MTEAQTEIRKTWVAFGENGAIASIHRTDDGFEVRRLDRDGSSSVYETLEIAKRAVTAHRGSDVTFEEH